jgi:hypothetical protein
MESPDGWWHCLTFEADGNGGALDLEVGCRAAVDHDRGFFGLLISLIAIRL